MFPPEFDASKPPPSNVIEQTALYGPKHKLNECGEAAYPSNNPIFSQPSAMFLPEFNASKPPPSTNVIHQNVLYATKHKLPGCSEAVTSKTRRLQETGNDDDACSRCLQRKIRIDSFKRELQSLKCQDEFQKLMYKKKLEEYQLGKDVLLRITGEDVFRAIEEDLEGPQAAILEILSRSQRAQNELQGQSTQLDIIHSANRVNTPKASDLLLIILEMLGNSNFSTNTVDGPSERQNRLNSYIANNDENAYMRFNNHQNNSTNSMYASLGYAGPSSEYGAQPHAIPNEVTNAAAWLTQTPRFCGHQYGSTVAANMPNGFETAGVVSNVAGPSCYISASQGPNYAQFNSIVTTPTNHPLYTHTAVNGTIQNLNSHPSTSTAIQHSHNQRTMGSGAHWYYNQEAQ